MLPPCVGQAAYPRATRVTVHPTTGRFQHILKFDARRDPDRPFVTASQPLAPTAFNAALKANPNATVDRARVMPLVVCGELIGNRPQGSRTIAAPTFANWQYIDRLVVWGGTSQRNVTAPGQAWIDAAHRNGVKIYGNIFLAPTEYGGNIEQVRHLTQKDASGAYVVGDRLIEIAEAQGFDGWFFNQETQGGDAALAEEVARLLEYIQEHSGIEVIWYDAMTESGRVRWQDSLTEQNDRFFQHEGRLVADAMFLDFTAWPGQLLASRELARRLGRSEFDLYAGANLESRGIRQAAISLNRFLTSADGGGPAASVGLYRPDKQVWLAFRESGWDPRVAIRGEQQIYVGQAGDPSNTEQPVKRTRWRGFAHHLAAKTPLTRDRFVSCFNYGLGKAWFLDGEKVLDHAWNNLGAQDVLPTWRWIVQTDDPTPVSARFDFDDAYFGGSSLLVTGSLDEPTDLPLYLAKIPVHNDSRLTLTYKTGRVGPTGMRLFVSFEGDETTRVPFEAVHTRTDGWNETDVDLSAHTGRKIAEIGVRFTDLKDPNYRIALGQIGVVRGPRDLVAQPTGLAVQDVEHSDQSAAVRLVWDHSEDYSADYDENNVHYYLVRQHFTDGGWRLLGVTGGEGLYLEEVEREPGAQTAELTVEAIGLEFGSGGDHGSISFPWPSD